MLGKKYILVHYNLYIIEFEVGLFEKYLINYLNFKKIKLDLNLMEEFAVGSVVVC
jgi:hypothetical protein